eukprot:365126-Chlamydomonas_euryale.AAC.59
MIELLFGQRVLVSCGGRWALGLDANGRRRVRLGPAWGTRSRANKLEPGILHPGRLPTQPALLDDDEVGDQLVAQWAVLQGNEPYAKKRMTPKRSS